MSWIVPGSVPTIGDNGGPPLNDTPEKPAAEIPISYLNPIQSWADAKGVVSVWTKHEQELRTELAKAIWPEPRMGVNRKHLGDGYALKMTFSLNYSVDKGKIGDAIAKLYTIEGGQAFVESLIKYEPKLIEGAYNAVPWDNPLKQILAEAITTKPALPQMELETPSEKIPHRKG